jgi:hypothetical protein
VVLAASELTLLRAETFDVPDAVAGLAVTVVVPDASPESVPYTNEMASVVEELAGLTCPFKVAEEAETPVAADVVADGVADPSEVSMSSIVFPAKPVENDPPDRFASVAESSVAP